MNNRIASSPILPAIVLSLAISTASADLTVPRSDSSYSAPAPLETIPAPPPSTAKPTVATTAATAQSAKPAVSVATTATTSASTPIPKHTIPYTVVKGDSLTSIANKFNSTRKKLKALNNLTLNTVKPGQVLLVPSTKSAKTALATTAATAKPHHTYLEAQPVQDFDIPASTFASCPVPSPSSDEDTPAAESGDSSGMTSDEKPAPVAELVSPAEMAADERKRQQSMAAMMTAKAPPSAPAPSGLLHPSSQHGTNFSSTNAFTSTLTPSSPKPASHFNFNPFSNQNATASTAATDWGNRFLQQARALGSQGIGYDDDWRPPGESRSWTMDCSNTTRYLYKVTTGIQLPRTASDQYYYLHLQGKAWDVPQIANGMPDTNYLRQNLKPGDLLFWENTYRPERQPPITHVMVYLGTDAQGRWLMAGSQSSRGGEHNRRNGGPDVYVFRPSQPCGGYTTWLGMVHHTGRFCAFGRPLEADRSKLSVAEND
jgi:LysM repeat protein